MEIIKHLKYKQMEKAEQVRIEKDIYKLCEIISKTNGVSIRKVVNYALLQGLCHEASMVSKEALDLKSIDPYLMVLRQVKNDLK